MPTEQTGNNHAQTGSAKPAPLTLGIPIETKRGNDDPILAVLLSHPASKRLVKRPDWVKWARERASEDGLSPTDMRVILDAYQAADGRPDQPDRIALWWDRTNAWRDRFVPRTRDAPGRKRDRPRDLCTPEQRAALTPAEVEANADAMRRLGEVQP